MPLLHKLRLSPNAAWTLDFYARVVDSLPGNEPAAEALQTWVQNLCDWRLPAGLPTGARWYYCGQTLYVCAPSAAPPAAAETAETRGAGRNLRNVRNHE